MTLLSFLIGSYVLVAFLVLQAGTYFLGTTEEADIMKRLAIMFLVIPVLAIGWPITFVVFVGMALTDSL